MRISFENETGSFTADGFAPSEGNLAGLGLRTVVKPHRLSKAVYPILSYTHNINGGNAPEPLVLDGQSYMGEERLYRKAGVLAGVGLGLNGRRIFGAGRYITYAVQASHARSVKYGLGVTTTGASLCSVNHIKSWWYLDLCGTTSRVRKDITDETNSTIGLTSAKVLKTGEGRYSEAKLGVTRLFAEGYGQNQLRFEYNTLHKGGIFSAVDVMFGDHIANQLTTWFSVSGRLSRPFGKKPLSLAASYSKADGGMLLGFPRREASYGISVAYPLWRNVKASIGYRMTNSNIDYFDVRTPEISVQFTPVAF